MQLYLGLDMATHNSGVALFSSDKKLIEHINIYGGDGDIIERCKCIYDQLDKFLDKYNNITYVAIEDTLLNKFVPNLNTCRDLITLKGWIQSLLYKHKLPFDIWTPNEWKSKVDVFNGPEGKTRAIQKQRAINLVKSVFNIEVDDNQADAICLAIAQYIHMTDDWSILEVWYESKVY
jgi:Holliday junction resolvasome RuvABC endonuclease subunit